MSSNDLFEKVSKILEKVPEERSSYYQLKYFVLGKEPTTQGQLWRCLKEIQTGKETIDSINLQIEDLQDDLDLLELEVNKIKDLPITLFGEVEKISLRKLKRKKESLLANIDKLNKAVKFKTEEIRFFVQAFEKLDEIEPVKDYDDFDAQQEYWETKISEEINLKILMHQPLNTELIRMALSLPDESNVKNQMLRVIENNKVNLVLEMKKDNNASSQ